jgi:hypothetical protein
MGKHRSLVDDYNIIRPRDPRGFELRQQNLLQGTDYWLTTRKFFRSEAIPILEGSITKDVQLKKHLLPDILFEYLVIRAVTILEIQLKYYCNRLVKKFPERAEKLLKNRDKKKDLALQILSTYSFSNLSDIKHVFSTLLGKDYFQVLRHRSEESRSSIGYEPDHLRYASPLFKKWNMFVQLIKLRNRFVHENKHIKIKSKKVRKNLLNMVYEVNYLTSFEEDYLPYNEHSFDEIRPVY